jgi:pyruvate formate lyase activating enzyme
MATSGERGLVYDIQRFSVHDGPGIRTTVFFKGCPLRCRWCQNPESLRPRVEIAFFADRCRSSAACLTTCPTGALAPGTDRVVRERCDGCGACVPACAWGALQPVGREWGAEELAAEAARDAPFFAVSEGGVTLSGGEPTLQMGFALDLATRLRARGIGVGLQTCGAFAWEDFLPLLSQLEFVHFDLKLSDPQAHQRWTGSDNAVILENARRLASRGAPVTFRMPVVPGVNDGEENLRATAEFLASVGRPRLQLLPYHSMGEAKRVRVGSPTPPLGLPVSGATAAESLASAGQRLRARGIEVT